MAYQAWSVVFGEQPSASKWNILGTNDAGFHDGSNIDDDAILTRHILDGNITPAKLAFGLAEASVATSQTTTSTSWADLATAGPSATVTAPSTGAVLIIAESETQNSTDGARAEYSLVVSGANTISEDDQRVRNQSRAVATSVPLGASKTIILTGLTPGSTTFKMRYRVQSGTGTFLNRRIVVVPFAD